jgi:hypothetical protein
MDHPTIAPGLMLGQAAFLFHQHQAGLGPGLQQGPSRGQADNAPADDQQVTGGGWGHG